jgi:hypothetical protein
MIMAVAAPSSAKEFAKVAMFTVYQKKEDHR